MPDRSVAYRFQGNFANLTAGLTTAGRNVTELGVKMTALDRNGAKMRAGLTQLGSTGGKVGLVFAAGVAVAVRAAANFEQGMSNVQAATHETAENMDLLRQAALDAGQATQFSATEAASAVENLAKAGVSTADILAGGLAGAMDLAAAGGLEVADAAEIAATALTQFKLSGEDVPHVADLLAAGAGKAQGDVADLSMALKQSGLVASQMGVSIEETTGTLAAFASAGLLGSDAGTSFRTMLLRMANPTKESADLMEQLGISAYDAQGNFVGIESLAGQLQVAFQGQSQATRDAALATIFGSDAIRAASVLYEQGAAGVADWTDKVNDQGYAAETAAIKMDNLNGDLEQLRGSLETALIGAGGGAQGPLRDLVQGLTTAVNLFNDLPPAAQSTVTAMGGITAITGGSLWFGSKVISGIANTKQALENLGISSGKSTSGMKLATKGLLALTAGMIAYKAADDALGLSVGASEIERMTTLLDARAGTGLEDQIKATSDAIAEQQEIVDGAAIAINLGVARIFSDDEAAKAQDRIDGLTEHLKDLQNQLDVQNVEDTGTDLKNLFTDLGAFTGDAAAGLDAYAGATVGAGEAAGLAAEDIEGMVKSMQDSADAAVAAFDAVTGYRQAMKDAAKQAKESNAGINGNSKAALANRDALSGLISRWNSLDQTVTDNVGKFKQARDNFITTATAMGVPKKAAEDLWREMAKIPSSKVIPVTTPGAPEAIERAKTLKQILDGLHSKDINIGVHYQMLGNKPPAPTPGGQTPRVSGRGAADDPLGNSLGDHLRRSGLDTVAPRAGDLNGQAEAKAAYALSLLAKGAHDAGEGTKGLKERLADLEGKLDKASRAADRAHDALDSLKDQRAGLASSVSSSLSHDPFGGSLQDFQAQTDADTADAQTVLAALQQLVNNGLDPHSTLFQRLAGSGNVSLIQQFAALSREQLAAEQNRFTLGQSALSQTGQFAGNQAFNDLIAKQDRTVDRLDGTVRDLTHQVNHLGHQIDQMGDRIEAGLDRGGRKHSQWLEGAAERGTEKGTRAGQEERRRRMAATRRTGGGSR